MSQQQGVLAVVGGVAQPAFATGFADMRLVATVEGDALVGRPMLLTGLTSTSVSGGGAAKNPSGCSSHPLCP